MNTCEPIVATPVKDVLRCTQRELDEQLRSMVANSLQKLTNSAEFDAKPRAERRRIVRDLVYKLTQHHHSFLAKKIADGEIVVV